MSRFRMPSRIAPSPAAEEPGQQNAVSRLRSSREAQSRLLAERRGEATVAGDEPERLDQSVTAGPADRAEFPGKGKGEAERPRRDQSPDGTMAKGTKVKLVLLYRLPQALEPDLADIAGRDRVSMEYVLLALAREGREILRALNGEDDVGLLTEEAKGFGGLTEGVKVIGNPMTVYVCPAALHAMHRAEGDPWRALPKATVVGPYFTAIVARLTKAPRAE